MPSTFCARKATDCDYFQAQSSHVLQAAFRAIKLLWCHETATLNQDLVFIFCFSAEFSGQRKSSSLPSHYMRGALVTSSLAGEQGANTQRSLIDDSVLEERTSLTTPEVSDDGESHQPSINRACP